MVLDNETVDARFAESVRYRVVSVETVVVNVAEADRVTYRVPACNVAMSETVLASDADKVR